MRGHIMLSAVTVGPECVFYGVSTPCGDMYEISILLEKEVPFKKAPRITFLAQDVALGIRGGFGPIDWSYYDGDDVIETINKIPADSDRNWYVKVPIVIRIDDVINEIS